MKLFSKISGIEEKVCLNELVVIGKYVQKAGSTQRKLELVER